MKTSLAAVSHELEFAAIHWDEIEDILADRISIDPEVKRLTERTQRLANEDADNLLQHLHAALSREAKGLFRFDNARWSTNDWDVWSNIFPHRKRRRVAYVGLYIGAGCRLLAYARLRPGGIEDQRIFRDACRKHKALKHAHLTEPPLYHAWGDHVVWFDLALKPGMSLESISASLRRCSKAFFSVSSKALSPTRPRRTA